MRNKILTFLLLLLVLLALLAALFWHQNRYVRPFDASIVLFDSAALRLPDHLAGEGPIRLVHFWEPSCPCNAGNQQHLAEIMREFAGTVQFYHVQKSGSKGQLPMPLQAMRPLEGMPGSELLPASPAVAIFDHKGTLAYFGPYSEGAVCTASNSFIEPVLQALQHDRPVAAASTLASGCFCDW